MTITDNIFVIAEINKLSPITQQWAWSEHPFVVKFKFYYGPTNAEVATFWTSTFGVSVPLTTKMTIVGIVYKQAINYSLKNTLAEVLLAQQSFYFDFGSQELYIHLKHDQALDLSSFNFNIGTAFGLTADKVRYFNDQSYMPFLLSYPIVETQVDKFNYDQMTFITSALKFSNKTGYFNQFKEIPIYGNKLVLKTGKEGDSYAALVTRATYVIEDYNFSALEFTVDVQDIRKLLTLQLPAETINAADFPDASDQVLGKAKPLGFHTLHDVPGICVNANALSSSVYPTFLFITNLDTSAAINIWVKIDDVWVLPTTGVTVDPVTKLITVNAARTVSGSTYGVREVKADLSGTAVTYASDIIKYLNSTYLNLTYDASTYDTTEWAAEETYLNPVAFYLDVKKDMYEWIKLLQSYSSVGFRYTITADGRYTIRVDNPNRTPIAAVPAIAIKNPMQVVGESNCDDIYNKISLGYNKSIINDEAAKVEDTTYFDISFAEYGVSKLYEKVTGLITEAEAVQRAAIQAEDYYKIHKNYAMTLIGDAYLDLQLYDIITVELKLLKYLFKSITSIEICGILTSSNVIKGVLTNLNIIKGVQAQHDLYDYTDDYFGTIRGQVVAIKPDYATKTNTILLRERAYSTVWEGYYGP